MVENLQTLLLPVLVVLVPLSVITASYLIARNYIKVSPNAVAVLRFTVLGDKHPVRTSELFAPSHRGSRPDPRARALARPSTLRR